MTTEPPKLPPEEEAEAKDSRDKHLEALRDADEALEEAGDIIVAGRARLQASILAYQERARDPRL